ncbi:MAG: transcription-repair coupling factor [Acidobacteria bacterium]|nr:MAG: transcription-repair coupling factor [Acidobacteriota bacterium]
MGASIRHRLEEAAEFKKLLRVTGKPHATITLSGLLSQSGKALILAALAVMNRKPIAYIASETELEALAEAVRFFYRLMAADRDDGAPPLSHHPPMEAPAATEAMSTVTDDGHLVVVLPPLDVDPYRGVSPHPATLAARAHALFRLSRREAAVALIPWKSLLTRTLPPAHMAQWGRELRVGEACEFEALIALLPRMGYRREDPVTAVGEFSVRGGIVDVFTTTHPRPLRIEFFGDDVVSIREFDPDTQRSVGHLEQAHLAPLTEVIFDPQCLRQWAEVAMTRWTDPLFRREVKLKCGFAEAGEAFQGWEFHIPLVKPHRGTVFDYLADALFFVDEPALLASETEKFLEHMNAKYEEALEAGELALEPTTFFLTADEVNERLKSLRRVDLSALGHAARVEEALLKSTTPASMSEDSECVCQITLPASPMRRFRGQIEHVVEDIKKAQRQQMSVWLIAHSKGMAERLTDMLGEYDVTVLSEADAMPESPLGNEASRTTEQTGNHTPPAATSPVHMVIGPVRRGFAMPWAKLFLLAEGDIFQETDAPVARPRSAPSGAKLSAFLSDFRDLKPGDYVVHIDHGIGRFRGLVELDMNRDGGTREFLLLEYAEGAKLYVPVERLDLVQKYANADGTAPALDRLGGTSWERTKARARRALRDMAEELLKLYAERQLVKGFAFGPDSPWQREFEDGFEYELTPDQETAIAEVKRDMEQPMPMDRLLCGDVGFGKTEVAMRAAFKAVMDGKQVAVLVPTTVLAHQHFQTFRRRFAPFPIKVEMLSRFRRAKEQKRILDELADGLVDIIIGTHRLLSRDVQFRDLGLVIIDEEQRFGVVHKERLKQLRRRVDVLTLTATPIPRTLSMSLMGLKPMSVIETPPRDRMAIQTIFAPFSPTVIKTAIERELERDGQVFFIHNRVESIHAIADFIRRLVPGVRLGVSHAQMPANQLERVMMKFIDYELDVLVATTVIENGIDIPRANTIIINHAEQFGLAELYQLRGRVGRSNRQAYAYLLIPPEQSLTPLARRRLTALKEFSDLGAGFRLAAADLELRGAGNVLGREQSGHIRAIGFELYCQMLERAIRELKGEVIEEETNTQIDLNIDIRIPESYIPDMGQRLRIYKRISSAPDEGRLQEICDELLDRYGPLPESVQHLLEYARLRREAMALGVLSIRRQRGWIHITFDRRARVDGEKLLNLIAQQPEARFTPDGVWQFRPRASDGVDLLREVKNCLMGLR